jgi:hypothetical protein
MWKGCAMLRSNALLAVIAALAFLPRVMAAEPTSQPSTQPSIQPSDGMEPVSVKAGLELAINGRVAATEARQGWPLLIDLTGPSHAAEVEVSGADGKRVAWPIKPLPTRSDRVSWALAPGQTVTIPAGEYTLRVRGPTTAPAARVTILASSTPTTSAQQDEGLRLQVSYLWRTGDRDAAKRTLADAIKAAPDHVGLLMLEGDLLMAGSEYGAAADAYASAMDARARAVQDGEDDPPTLLMAKWHAATTKAGRELLHDPGK